VAACVKSALEVGDVRHATVGASRDEPLEFRQLKYFVAAAEESNFTRAAAREKVAPSTLGEQIAALEREIGGPLFHRTTRRVSLTAAGRALLVEARACLSAVNRAQQAPRLVIQRQQGALRLGVPITGNPPQLDDALQTCSRRYPGLRVEAHRGYSARHAQALLAGRLDAAVVFGVPEPMSGLSYQRLAVVELQLVCPDRSPLAEQDQINLGQLDGLALMALDATLSPALGPALISTACGSSAADVETADSLEALLMTVAAGGAVTLLPKAVTSTVTWRGVCYRSLGAAGLGVELGISWPGEAPPALVACLVDSANWGDRPSTD